MPQFIIKTVRKLAGLPGPSDDFWYEPIGQASATGVQVTASSSLRAATVYACVRLLSETIASLPLVIYRRLPGGGKERANNHPLFDLLHSQPNSWQTAFEFIEMMQGHLELRGNAYAEIIAGQRGFVDQLIPLHPDRVEVFVLPSGQLDYRHRERDGTKRHIDQDSMFHVRGWGSNSFVGLSPIALASEAIAMSLAAQEYGARFFQNDAQPGGWIEHPNKLTQPVQERLSESWQKAHTAEKRHKVAILEEGMKYHEVGLTNKDAQFLESRKFQAEEIARIFRVQPHKVGLMDSATFSNIEFQAIEFVTDTLLPRLRRWEQAISRDLIIAKQVFFAEFLVDGLLRGDIKSRYEAYKIALGGGGSPAFTTVNEVRARENLNPIGPEGDKLFVPMNVQPVGLDEADQKRLAAFALTGDGGKNGEKEAT